MNITEQNYNNFFSGLSTGLLRELGSGYKTRGITNTKNNGILKNGILISREMESFAPAIYLDEYYEDFCSGKCLNDIIRQVLYTYRGGSEPGKRQSFHEIDFSPLAMRDKIILRIVNYARNASGLQDIPYIRIRDLAIIFHFIVYQEAEGIGTIKLTKEHFIDYADSSAGKTPIFSTLGELFHLALENTKRLFPVRLSQLDDVLQTLLTKQSAPSIPFHTNTMGNAKTGDNLFVFTNTSGTNGASCILYPDIIPQLTHYFGTDFYILPSSIHELLLLPSSTSFCQEELNDMIREINLSQVPEDEVLSDQSYYSRDFAQLLKLPDSVMSTTYQ
ncbi:MAG: hypothetical protein K2N63_05705 [Lachnospiraceae bacterium]|nr:hypothetical protein [Lachnospiraceae bacterium]